jgi:DNA-binding phage protein
LVIVLCGGTKKRQQHDIDAAVANWQAYKRRKRRTTMALTRDFKETIRARAVRDAKFRKELLRQGIESLVTGDIGTAKTILRDYINATVGFAELAEATRIPSKSLMRMLGPSGNPRADNLFVVVGFLQRHEGVRFVVRACMPATYPISSCMD